MNSPVCDAYVDEVMRFRKGLNLTSINNHDEFVRKFITPSLALLSCMPKLGRVLDIGSGMGVPGIPLLMANTGLYGVLVERRKKRAEFLRHVVRKLALRCDVYDADINDLPRLNVDICVARAVTDERDLLKMCSLHVNPSAIAVLPVPSLSHAVVVDGWTVFDEQRISIDGNEQLIRCYRYE
ncbi:MAG: class I SAM-dependent methyltransferase [Mariprofundus sp.]|nr:class I SAM-dependent methyltransferase [Mariprofundus sp.]